MPSFFCSDGSTYKYGVIETINFGKIDEVKKYAAEILNNAENYDVLDLLEAYIKHDELRKFLCDNIENLTFPMNWFTLKKLLEIEEIDINILATKFYNVFDQLLAAKDADPIMLINVSEDLHINDADEITKLIERLVLSDKVSNDCKKNIISKLLQNLDNIIDNSIYSFKTIRSLLTLGLKPNQVLKKKEKIANNISGSSITDFYKFCEKNGEKLEIDFDKYIELMLKGNDRLFPNTTREQELKSAETALWTIKKIIYELMEHQNIAISDISYIASGYFKNVFKVGEYVVKIGFQGENREIPHSKHIIQPLIRQELKRGVFIEVQNLADTKWHEGLSEEEIEEKLFEVYSNLRNDAIDWRDIRKENVGMLLKPNSSNLYIDHIEYNNGKREKVKQEMHVPDSNVNFVGRNDNEILPEGNLVIIDLDYLVGKGGRADAIATEAMWRKFSDRYDKEHSKGIEK